MKQSTLQSFANPGGEFRGVPFWAWNGELDPAELRRQVRLMHRMGLGGFFMHSRVGLETPYLKAKWFDCVRACVEEASKLDMRAWLYDEDRWPSGFAGGYVTRKQEFRSRRLQLQFLSEDGRLDWDESVVAVFSARIRRGRAYDVRQLPRSKGRVTLESAAGEKLGVFRVVPAQPTSWFNGQTYVDTLNPRAVREFLRVTHESYRREVGEHFGKRIPGIFTDEPNFFQAQDGLPAAPWTSRLPLVFKKRHGYDVVPRLPELFFIVDDQLYSKVRRDFFDCVTSLFVDAYARQIGEWCERNGLMHTGHLLCEDTLSEQAYHVGSCMRFYEHMQAPGIDVLSEHRRVYDTAKQASSVARQFDRKWRLSETYGCTGWDFPFLGHKALGDWQAVLGVTLRSQHLSWYTMQGQAKRDYPAGIFYQSPWWDIYSKVEDYFARINAVMTEGREVRDLLVIHPIESAWMRLRWGDPPGTRSDEETSDSAAGSDLSIIAVRDTLLSAHVDFDYGDEEIIAVHGSTRIHRGTARLWVGKADYTAVLVPPMATMRQSTLDLLRLFRRKGGLVIFAGEPPVFVDGVPSSEPAAFADNCVRVSSQGNGLADAVAPIRRVSIADPQGLEIPQALYLLREDAACYYLLIVNTGHAEMPPGAGVYDPTAVRERKAFFPAVVVRGFQDVEGAPIELDPDTGKTYSLNAVRVTRRDGRKELKIRTSLETLGTRLFALPKKPEKRKPQRNRKLKEVASRQLGKNRWRIRLSEANVLVLDRAALRVNGRSWKRPDDVLKIDNEIRDSLGIARRGAQMVQPWARERPSGRHQAGIDLLYTFAGEHIPSGELFLAIEQPKRYRIFLNEHELSTEMECGWWCDRSLRRIQVNPLFLKTAVNELRLSCVYHANHPGLENIYLLGNFGVRIEGAQVTMIEPPTTLLLGDWVQQGLPFYSGSTVYETTAVVQRERGEHLFLVVPDFRGTAVRVLVNGASAGIIAWEPHEIEMTDFLRQGSNEIAIEVVSHRRNSHGPFHHADKWPEWTGAAQFLTTGTEWVEAYQLVPCGLFSAPLLSRRK